ncbi:hypothetical protein IE53DRAFT_48268 [Violaceomyces palustris]|uniref:Uncharacterized protein n=1 Tax=Violaceomyces palustris TaxID=1673888 RepID=A0ACD0P0J7_9BASI|nr:hypothetical protein IE53DRAFT_48268 [Violaceomyces palustris]
MMTWAMLDEVESKTRRFNQSTEGVCVYVRVLCVNGWWMNPWMKLLQAKDEERRGMARMVGEDEKKKLRGQFGRIGEQTWLERTEGYGWMDGWMVGRLDGWIGGRMVEKDSESSAGLGFWRWGWRRWTVRPRPGEKREMMMMMMMLSLMTMMSGGERKGGRRWEGDAVKERWRRETERRRGRSRENKPSPREVGREGGESVERGGRVKGRSEARERRERGDGGKERRER